MNVSLLNLLRCPYCGGRLSLVESLFHRATDNEIRDGILGCHCCIFPVVDGVPVLHLQPAATSARDHVQAEHPELALQAMFGFEDERAAETFTAVAVSPTATYRATVAALGPNFEGGYFLYRFSDPTFIVADAVVRSLARTVARSEAAANAGRPMIDVCGGSGHLTRSLVDLSPVPPVLADLYFAKVWLARRFTAPGCEPVCCDGNAPLPFARGAFSLAICVDAFMYIWTKRQFVGEMTRLVDAAGLPGSVLIGHTHNERTWSPSHGQPLPPEGYADLFETSEPRLFGEAGLFADVVDGVWLDLSRRDSKGILDADPALTIIASTHAGVFARHPIEHPSRPRGEYRINPLYTIEANGDRMRLRLSFPSEDYEQEYGACRQYLPDQAELTRAELEALSSGVLPGAAAELAARRVILDLPERYY